MRFSQMIHRLLLKVVSPCRCADQEHPRYSYPNLYSSSALRRRWTARLKAESTTPIHVSYHPLGHLTGLAGSFLIVTPTVEGLTKWLTDHAEMLGTDDGTHLEMSGEEVFHEVLGPRKVIETLSARNDSSTPLPELEDRETARTYHLSCFFDGYPVLGGGVSLVVRKDERVLRGLFSNFSPAVEGYSRAHPLSEEEAWQIAERKIAPLKRLSAIQGWFDIHWALYRLPKSRSLCWHLTGTDEWGRLRQIVVDSASAKMVFATPDSTSFEVRQTHMTPAGEVLWDSLDLPGGCQGSPGCSGDALVESQSSRVVLPKIVDLWYNLSSSSTVPLAWPLPGQYTGPFTNRSRSILAVLAVGPQERFDLLRWENGRYYFPLNSVNEGQFGHEYGHRIMEELRLHPGGSPFQKDANGNSVIVPPATLTECMCDLIGIVSLNSDSVAPDWWQGNFELGTYFYHNNKPIAPGVSWGWEKGTCSGLGRARLGHAFYQLWLSIMSIYGERPIAVRNTNFRAWWVTILRTLATASNFGSNQSSFSFPDISDFHAAAVSRLSTAFDIPLEAGAAYKLVAELEALQLDTGCY